MLETGTTQVIGERVGIPLARCAKALAVLKQAALIERTGQYWSASTDVWRQVAPRRYLVEAGLLLRSDGYYWRP